MTACQRGGVFIRRCLNAAVNLYGILTYPEFIDLYNGYAREHPRPISDTLTKDELQDFVVRHLDDIEGTGCESDDNFLYEPDVWFASWYCEKTGEDLLVHINLVTVLARLGHFWTAIGEDYVRRFVSALKNLGFFETT